MAKEYDDVKQRYSRLKIEKDMLLKELVKLAGAAE